MSSEVSDQAIHKLAGVATEASYSLQISAIESRDIILSKQRTTSADQTMQMRRLICAFVVHI